MASRFPAKKPNVRDVARQAGVSVATVSRVLNHSPLVNGATRDRVEHAIEALQFVPSSAARAINSGRTRLVGALVPSMDHAIFARFIEAVEEHLDERRLSLIVAHTRYDSTRELEKARKLLDIGVEGLIVSGVTRAAGFGAVMTRHKVPVVATSFFKPDDPYPTIGYDNIAVARTALDHLLTLGHRDIAVLTGPTRDNDRTRERLRGLEAMGAANLHVIETALSFAGAVKATQQVMDQPARVTAFLCLSDVLAQGALMSLSARGVRVPEDISVIGMDDLPASASFAPPLTTVHLPVASMGRAAASAIADWIETSERPEHSLLETRLVERKSTGPAPTGHT